MPEIPERAVQSVAERMFRRYENENYARHLSWRDFADDARADLEASAPILAEAVAQAILAHAERQHPRDKDHVPTAWDRHFSVAARVAAMAFYSREDELRLAAEAIARGDVIACNPPEVPG